MAETDCLAGCISNYLCNTLDLPGPAGQQAESFAPWCWITMGVGTDKITVGNESYEGDPNTACIKSMEIGWVDTPSMKCEIVDEKGGTLGIVADAIRKCLRVGNAKGGGKGTLCEFQFGWIMTTCSGEKRVIPSKKFSLIIMKLDVNYSEGKIKYMIEGVAMDKITDVSRVDENKGEDLRPVNIETAIRSLAAQDPPFNVRFVELTPDGKLKDVKFEWAAVPGKSPKASWQSDNMNRMSVITKWLSSFRIKDGKCDKGLVLFWSPDKSDELIILKDPMTGPGESRQCPADNSGAGEWGPLGTFIVNGGKCSTVIEFTPTMNIISAIASMAVGGDTSGPNKSSNQFAEKERCDNQKPQGVDAGTQLQATITQQAFDTYGTRSANQQALKSEIAHNRASVVTSVQRPGIKAQIKILGNPNDRFCSLGACRNMSIVVINPFHIRNFGHCGDWLAYPGCNELFTNRLWMCQGINHSISVGSYTTTIEAMLVAPSVQISSFDPVGGAGGGGVTLKETCN